MYIVSRESAPVMITMSHFDKASTVSIYVLLRRRAYGALPYSIGLVLLWALLGALWELFYGGMCIEVMKECVYHLINMPYLLHWMLPCTCLVLCWKLVGPWRQSATSCAVVI